jgi:hypothetical protein
VLKELMDQSPDPHLPEERKRLPRLVRSWAMLRRLALEPDKPDALMETLKFWFNAVYDDNLRRYPQRRAPETE